jgi:hypothetical protein
MSFSFKSIGHAIAHTANELVTISKKVSSAIVGIKGHEEQIEALTSLVFPQAVELERAAFYCLGVLAEAVDAAGTAAASNGLNIKLDQDVVAAIQKLSAAVKDVIKAKGIQIGK